MPTDRPRNPTSSDRQQARQELQTRLQYAFWAVFGVVAVAAIAWLSVRLIANRPVPTPVAPGLEIEDLTVGTGNAALIHDEITVHYTGYFPDGTQFDSSYDRGQPLTFTLGAGQVIEGWDKGLSGMKAGGKRRLTIPPELAYGEEGRPPEIPPNATLVFEVELLEIRPLPKITP